MIRRSPGTSSSGSYWTRSSCKSAASRSSGLLLRVRRRRRRPPPNPARPQPCSSAGSKHERKSHSQPALTSLSVHPPLPPPPPPPSPRAHTACIERDSPESWVDPSRHAGWATEVVRPCLSVSLHCLSLTDCLLTAFHDLPLPLHCLSLTLHCLLAAFP